MLWGLKRRSTVKFPYVLYVAIICFFILIRVCGIYVNDTVLVGAPFILGYHVKCFSIYLVPFECQVMSRWFPRQQVQFLIKSLVTHDMFLQPIVESFYVPTHNPGLRLPSELDHTMSLCSTIYGSTKEEFYRTVYCALRKELSSISYQYIFSSLVIPFHLVFPHATIQEHQ